MACERKTAGSLSRMATLAWSERPPAGVCPSHVDDVLYFAPRFSVASVVSGRSSTVTEPSGEYAVSSFVWIVMVLLVSPLANRTEVGRVCVTNGPAVEARSRTTVAPRSVVSARFSAFHRRSTVNVALLPSVTSVASALMRIVGTRFTSDTRTAFGVPIWYLGRNRTSEGRTPMRMLLWGTPCGEKRPGVVRGTPWVCASARAVA